MTVRIGEGTRALLFGAALLMAGAPARAPAQSDVAIKTARKLFKRGLAQYRLGRFEKALANFEAALKLTNRPSIVLNVAQCHRQIGNKKKALFYYKLYLTVWSRKHPNRAAPYVTDVKRYIAALQKALATATTGALKIVSTPAGAEVWLDGKLRGATPLELKGVAAGSHLVELRKGNMRFRGNVVVEAGKTASLAATLVELRGQLVVHSTPPGAELRLDGRTVGKTPQTIGRLPLGQYTLELRKPHHVTARRVVQLTGSEPLEVAMTLERLGAIAAKSDPPGASIYVDGKLAGTTPATIEVEGGSHQVKLDLARRQAHSQQVTVEPGATVAVSARLPVLPEIRARLTSRTWRLALAWTCLPLSVLGGLAAAGMIVSGHGDAGRANESYENTTVQWEMDQYAADSAGANNRIKWGWVAAGSSVALLAASIYFFASAPSRPAESAVGAAVVPLPAGAAVSLGGAF